MFFLFTFELTLVINENGIFFSFVKGDMSNTPQKGIFVMIITMTKSGNLYPPVRDIVIKRFLIWQPSRKYRHKWKYIKKKIIYLELTWKYIWKCLII